MTIDEAVSRSIERFLNEDIILEKSNQKGLFLHLIKDKNNKKHKSEDKDEKEKEDKPKDKEKKKDDTHKGVIKKTNGQRGDFDYENEKKSNPNITAGDQESLAKVLKSGVVNLAYIAQLLYPYHTPEGAQSQLRKKIKGLLSDSGCKYKLKQKEAKRLRIILNQLGLI